MKLTRTYRSYHIRIERKGYPQTYADGYMKTKREAVARLKRMRIANPGFTITLEHHVKVIKKLPL